MLEGEEAIPLPLANFRIRIMDTNAFALSFTLRPMVLNDAPVVAQIEAESYDDAWPLDDFVGWFDYPKGLATVCVDDTAGGTVAGFVLYERHFKRLHVADVAVAKLYRRRGIAQALLQHVASDARNRLCTRVTLEVRQSNAAAIACYKALGYVEKKVIPNYYEDGEAAIYMQLRLKKPSAGGRTVKGKSAGV